jgi:hypothetical protein
VWGIQLATGEGTVLEPVSQEKLAGAVSAEFKVDTPGAHRVTLKAWPKDADAKTATPSRQETVDVTVG